MNAFLTDPKTGFLTAENLNSFTAERKVRLLELTEKHVKETGKWPDLSSLCDAVDIDPRTLERHLKLDPKFNDAFKNLTLRGKWKLESNMFDLSSKNPLYMFGWLRRFFPEEYSPEYRVNVQHDVTLIQGLQKDANAVIDAELVE